jgi:hypothetical protein
MVYRPTRNTGGWGTRKSHTKSRSLGRSPTRAGRASETRSLVMTMGDACRVRYGKTRTLTTGGCGTQETDPPATPAGGAPAQPTHNEKPQGSATTVGALGTKRTGNAGWKPFDKLRTSRRYEKCASGACAEVEKSAAPKKQLQTRPEKPQVSRQTKQTIGGTT